MKIFYPKRIAILILCISMAICAVVLILTMLPLRQRVAGRYLIVFEQKQFFFVSAFSSDDINVAREVAEENLGFLLLDNERFFAVVCVFLNRADAEDFIRGHLPNAVVLEIVAPRIEILGSEKREKNEQFFALVENIRNAVFSSVLQIELELRENRITQSHAITKLTSIRNVLNRHLEALNIKRQEFGLVGDGIYHFTGMSFTNLTALVELRFNSTLENAVRYFLSIAAYQYIEVIRSGSNCNNI